MLKGLKKKKNNKGFTLVELLVVIAIIGVLAVVAVPSLFTQIEKSKVASLQSDISAIKSVTIAKYADGTLFPKDAVDNKVETLLAGEIDGLAKKLGGEYTIETNSSSKDIELKITGIDLSTKAASTLDNDLGAKYVVADKILTYTLVDVKE